MAINYKSEYMHLVNFVGKVLDELEAMRDETDSLAQAFATQWSWAATERCNARSLALQDAIDLWENTEYA